MWAAQRGKAWCAMNWKLPRLLLATACLVLASCRATKVHQEEPIVRAPIDLPGDYARLQGVWVVESSEAKGAAQPEMAGRVFVIERDRLRRGDERGGERFAVDEKATPKRIDFDDGHSPLVRGIYRLEGNELTICAGGPGEERPKAFTTSGESTAELTRLKRK